MYRGQNTKCCRNCGPLPIEDNFGPRSPFQAIELGRHQLVAPTQRQDDLVDPGMPQEAQVALE